MIKIEITGEDMETVKAQAGTVFGVSASMSLEDVLEGYSLQEIIAGVVVRADAEGYDLSIVRKGSPAEQKKAEAKAKLRDELIGSLKQVNTEVETVQEAVKVEPDEEPVQAEPEKPAKKVRKAKGSNGAAEAEPASETPAARKDRCLEKMRVMWPTNKKAIEALAKKYANGDTRRFVLLPEEKFEAISAELEEIV